MATQAHTIVVQVVGHTVTGDSDAGTTHTIVQSADGTQQVTATEVQTVVQAATATTVIESKMVPVDLTVDTSTETHNQSLASASWVITHAWPGGYPSVTIVDTNDDEIIGEVTYDSDTQITVSFTAAISGKAYLN